MSMKFKDTIDGSIAKNSATATKLATARTITIGSKGKTFDGSDNVKWTLDEIGAAASSHNHDDRYYTESEINTKVSALQSEIDADVKVEADRAKAAENTLQANIDKKANSSHGNHVPKTETANNAKFLRNDNTWQTVTPGNIGAYTKTEIDSKIDSKVTTINNAISGKADKSHGNHVPATETANNAKFLRNDNTWQTVTPDNIGAAKSSHGTHVTYATAAPKAPGTAAIGTVNRVAREDHVHPLQTTVSGNAGSATKLATAREIKIGNTGKNFDGSANVSWTLSEIGAAASSHNHTHVNKTMITTTLYNAEAGTLVDFNLNEKSGAMVILKLYGNSYSTNPPIEAIYQFYDYASGDIGNGTGSAISGPPITLKVYRIGGKLKAWFKQPNSYCTFKLEVAYGNNSSTPNVTLSNAAEPTGATQTVTITPNRVYSAAYKPTPSDIGAAKESHGTHVTYASSAPKANGTAAVGSSGKVAREDHVHPLQTSVSGNAGTATKLQTARSINGTSFDGSGNITTANWGSSRNISISDSDGTNTGKAVSVNGSADTTLKLPATIKASLSGNAATATSAGKWTTARTLTIGNKGQSVNGSGNVSWSLADIGAVETVAWDASIKCATWSRLFQYSAANAVTGGSFLVNIQATRGNVVYGPTILVNFGHSSTCNIVQINNINYSDIKIRGVVDDNGAGYLEIYDNANGATNSTTQGVTVSVTKLTKGLSITKYTAFTNGTTIPTGYASKGEITTVSGCYYTGKAATSGNADTAAKAGKWSTARTLTIGNKGKSVDGSENVSWSLSEIGAAASGHNHDSTYSKTGHTHNYAGASSAGGVATSAAKLAAAKTITIGNAGKSFDGSANISYTLSEIGAAASGHTHTTINGVYTSNGGAQPPSYVGNGTVRFNMMNKFKGLDGLPTYADCILMDTYTGTDVPYVTGFGILKQSGDPRAFIAVGAKGNTSTWAKETELLTVANYKTHVTPDNIGAAKSSHGTHVTWSTTTPKANGTAAVGTETKVARGDHVHPLQTSVSGNAGTATKLATARTLTIGNKGKTFNGSADVSWTLAEIGASPLQKSVVSKSVSNGTLTLSTDRYQKATLASGNTIALPSVSNFTEINLFVKGALTNINLPDNCKWRVDHNLSTGTSYMFTFIYTTVEWLAEVKIYS